MNNNLPELRDIHLPNGVSIFPPAIGWWLVLLAIVATFFIYQLIKKAIKHSRKIYATKIINHQDTKNPVLFATTCSEIIRRICQYKHREAVGLKGAEWQNFLKQNCSYKLDDKSMSLLINAPYIKKDNKEYTNKEVQQIKAFSIKFVGENL